jgi:predicted kinase
MDKFVIMMNGHPACLKSTISKKLAEQMNIQLVRTNAFGGTILPSGFSSFESRNPRYQLAFKQAEELMITGVSLIFDGTFTHEIWRKQLYDLCEKYNYQIVIIRCISSNAEIIKNRFSRRAISEEQAEKDSIYFQNYIHDVPLDNAPYLDLINGKKPPIILFDSARLSVFGIYSSNDLSEKIFNEFLVVISSLYKECL